MKMLFSAVFYGFTNCFIRKNVSNLNTPAFLRVAAKYLGRFSLLSVHKPLQALTMERRWFLRHLEECIDTVVVSQCVALSKRETQTVLYVLHRLLDHGAARKLIVHVQCPVIFAWLLRERGPQLERRPVEDRDRAGVPTKLRKLDSASVKEEALALDPQLLCHMFPCGGGAAPAGACPRGRVEQLEVSQCRPDCLAVLTRALPSFSCLRSLSLHSVCTLGVKSSNRQQRTHTHSNTEYRCPSLFQRHGPARR